ncbi:hypothetical protein V7149_00445 [Bacillus sp. JJ1503]|uniref:hypothetical protein n=1 Tax=Bacillus sp. JJ1503 TaxID=3122956 RepID=UPI002FFFFCC5
MNNVKGMTTCTPEFHRVAKSAELEGEAKSRTEEILDELELADLPDGVWRDARARVADMFELYEGDCE